MNITVKLFASFRAGRFGEQVRPYGEGATPGEIIAELGIDPSEVGVLLANGRHAAFDQALAEGDILSVFPLIGGG